MRRRLDSAGVAGYSFFDGVDCRSEPPCAAYLDGLHDFVSLQINVSYQVPDDRPVLKFESVSNICYLITPSIWERCTNDECIIPGKLDFAPD
jgi:hypothetical protein